MYRYMKLFGFVVFFLFLGIAQVSRPVWGSRWSRTGDLTYLRCGYSGVGLTDGRVMVMATQYDLASGYEFFDPATGTWVREASLPPGTEGNIDHAMGILLPNGKVMYKSNIDPQIWLYDPFAETFNLSLASLNFQHNADATLLKDGQVLLMHDGQNCALYDYFSDAINPTGAANFKHLKGAEVLLPSGKVLVTGGGNNSWGGRSQVCELYDAGSWTSADSMNEIRGGHVTILFPPPWDNKVLVVGGVEGMMHPQKRECELYDIALDTWAYTDSVKPPRSTSTMALLPSGKAMIIGGNYPWTSPENNNQCEIYDPETEKWSDTDSMEVARGHCTSFILPTGKVLTAAGVDSCKGSYPEALTITAEIYDPSDGVWTEKPSLLVGRAAHTVTPLSIISTSNCSTNVLIVGGENSGGVLSQCELYNYSKDCAKVTDELAETRSHHTAVLLPDGKVLVAGGKDGATIRSSSELYDVTTQLWTTTAGAMTDARYDHSATLLANGDVLVTGGEDAGILKTCEIYNGGSWTPIPVMTTPRARHTAIILLNGNILVIGGQTTGGATATCELWNGTNWTGKADMSTARYWHTATLLQSGKVLVIGGTTNGGTPLLSCEVFDPDSNKWFLEADLNTARFQHNTTLLYSGLVLVTGGSGGITSCEIWDPAAGWDGDTLTNTHKWKVTASLTSGRAYHSSVLVPDTMPFILAIGGRTGGGGYLNSIEEYDVGLGYRKIWQSTITNHSAVTLISPSMDIEGTDFRGFSEADGGNYCHIANNDHPIISLVRVGGGNWQGNGGGEILHMPLSSYWDTANTTVHPEITSFQGYYRLWSIVNGIPCKWEMECNPGTGVEDIGTTHKLSLQVLPSPSPGIVYIKFATYGPGLVVLKVYDCAGRLVRNQKSEIKSQKSEVIRLDGLKSGIYFYHIKYGDLENKGRFIILK